MIGQNWTTGIQTTDGLAGSGTDVTNVHNVAAQQIVGRERR
jgi:hypothetical protein